MFIIRNSIGCGQCLRPKMLSDIFSFSFTLLLPNWLLISIRIYSGIAQFPCDSMAFLLLYVIGYCLDLKLNFKAFNNESLEDIEMAVLKFSCPPVKTTLILA